MNRITIGETAKLAEIRERLIRLRAYLDSLDLQYELQPSQFFTLLANVKEIQGNSSNDSSFVACLLAKHYLSSRFQFENCDISLKPQGAPGLDFDLITLDQKRIVGELKTTVPYQHAKKDLGAAQRKSFLADFEKLSGTTANHKFFS